MFTLFLYNTQSQKEVFSAAATHNFFYKITLSLIRYLANGGRLHTDNNNNKTNY